MKNNVFKSIHARAEKKFGPKVKNLNFHDIHAIKFSVTAAVLFLLTVWPALRDLALSVHWGWYLGAMFVFALRPMKHFFGKGKKK
jgi:hypothetical protein